MKLKKGDKIKIMTGRDSGRDGVIERVYTRSNKLFVPGLNVYKKHVKKSDRMPQGGVVDVSRLIDASKVFLVCPKCGKPTRVGYQLKSGKKFRVCKTCEKVI